MRTLNDYLRFYHKKQDNTLLVYRPSDKHSWADRCVYLGDKYDEEKQYNHRLILTNEVVIEFDQEDPQENDLAAQKVIYKLKKNKIKYASWDSGGKSIHVHFFIDPKKAGSIRLLKKCVLRYYTKGLKFKPDMRLATDSHLIRAENGLHERTGRRKRLIHKVRGYGEEAELPREVWQDYANLRVMTIKQRTSKDLHDAKCSCVNYIANSVAFRENDDGRERALFVLIHSLKHKYSKDDLVEYLQEWYRYSSGRKLSPEQIKSKVYYHYSRNYGTYTMVKDLLEELGKEDVLRQCEVHKDAR